MDETTITQEEIETSQSIGDESGEYQQFQLYVEKIGRILDDNLQVEEGEIEVE